MDPLSPIVLISTFFGGVSALTGLVGLYLQNRKINTFNTLRTALNEIKSDTTYQNNWRKPEIIGEWLQYGALIAGPFKTRLTQRFGLTLVIILPMAYAVTLDFDGSIFPGVPAFEWQDAIIVVLQIFAGLINATSLILNKSEKDFLIRLSALQSLFYKSYVIPAMIEFNLQMDKVSQIRNVLAAEENDKNRIRKWVEDAFAGRG